MLDGPSPRFRYDISAHSKLRQQAAKEMPPESEKGRNAFCVPRDLLTKSGLTFLLLGLSTHHQ